MNTVAGGTSTGVTLDTNNLRTAMQDLAVKCAAGTFAYASSVSDNTLKAKVNYKGYQLDKIKKEDVDDVCEGIRTATDGVIAAVAGFGVLPADTTDLKTAIDLYRIASQNPRQAIITKSQANKKGTVMIGEVITDLLIAQMDKMVDTLKVSNRGYWDGWKQAREIIDLGSTTAKVRGTVKDELDVPLSNARFSIFKTGTTTLVKMVVTDAKGKFNASGLSPGGFDFKWELTGYVSVDELNVKIAAGKELKRTIVLKKS